MPEQSSTLPPGSETFEKLGIVFLMNVENAMQRIRAALISFVRNFEHLTEDERVEKLAVIDAELTAVLSTFRALAENRGEDEEMEDEIRDGMTRRGIERLDPDHSDYYSHYIVYAHEVLRTLVKYMEKWRMLVGLLVPMEDSAEVLHENAVSEIVSRAKRTMNVKYGVSEKRVHFVGYAEIPLQLDG